MTDIIRHYNNDIGSVLTEQNVKYKQHQNLRYVDCFHVLPFKIYGSDMVMISESFFCDA